MARGCGEHGRRSRRRWPDQGTTPPPSRCKPWARGADVEVDVTRAQSKEVHRRQVPDRMGPVRVLHEFGPAGGAGGEVAQHRIIRTGLGGEP
jgi:hypothetical protein